MTCYRKGGCGPYEMYSCSDCPASKPGYAIQEHRRRKGEVIHLGKQNDHTDNMLESAIEAKLRKAVRDMGGECFKMVSPSMGGCPDRAIFLNGRTIWVELKKSTGTLRSDQERFHELINATGVNVYVTHGASGMNAFLEVLKCL